MRNFFRSEISHCSKCQREYCAFLLMVSFVNRNFSYKYAFNERLHLSFKGRHGDIKLIDPEQLICYQEVSHHKKAIDALVFHPHHPTWLFSMSCHISYAFLYHFFSIILVLSSYLTRHNTIEMIMYRAFILRTYGCIILIVIRIP